MLKTVWNRAIMLNVKPHLYATSLQYSRKTNEYFHPQITTKPISDSDIDTGKNLLKKSGNMMVITGAGVSTDSGIMDFQTLAEMKKKRLKLSKNENDNWRKYWAQSYVIWPLYDDVKANRCHELLNKMEQKNLIERLFTKNVDYLHKKAGSEKVTEMHGNVRNVVCSDCGATECRSEIQKWMEDKNYKNDLKLDFILETQPRGSLSGIEVDYTKEQIDEINRLQVPKCESMTCKKGSLLKPNVVLYNMSDNVKNDFDSTLEKVSKVLVLGTSLQDNFVPNRLEIASREGKSILIVNVGTVGRELDSQRNWKKKGMQIIHANCAEFLEKVYVES